VEALEVGMKVRVYGVKSQPKCAARWSCAFCQSDYLKLR